MIIESKFDDAELRDQIRSGQAAPHPTPDPARVVDQIVHRVRAGAGVDFDAYEALIGANDLVEINYLERGLMEQ